MYYPEPIAKLIDAFSRLPGIGPKTAARLAFYVLRMEENDVMDFAKALVSVKRNLLYCSICCNITDSDPCRICQDKHRDRTAICVVQEPKDLIAMERTKEFQGMYHVLHGAISPVDGIGPDKLKIRELVSRVEREKPEEVVVFTNLDLPGEATATYLHRILTPLGVNVTRPASGLPVGGDLEYADEMTLGRALAGRRIL